MLQQLVSADAIQIAEKVRHKFFLQSIHLRQFAFRQVVGKHLGTVLSKFRIELFEFLLLALYVDFKQGNVPHHVGKQLLTLQNAFLNELSAQKTAQCCANKDYYACHSSLR